MSKTFTSATRGENNDPRQYQKFKEDIQRLISEELYDATTFLNEDSDEGQDDADLEELKTEMAKKLLQARKLARRALRKATASQDRFDAFKIEADEHHNNLSDSVTIIQEDLRKCKSSMDTLTTVERQLSTSITRISSLETSLSNNTSSDTVTQDDIVTLHRKYDLLLLRLDLVESTLDDCKSPKSPKSP
jgi:chromosome segregation ATPase